MWWLRQVAGAAAVAAGAVFAFGAPRLTLVNSGLRVEYPHTQAAAAAVMAAGAALVAFGLRPRWARAGCVVLAVAAVAVAARRISYRLELDGRGVVSRQWGDETAVAWSDVSRIESGPARIVVWGGNDRRLAVDTSTFRPDQRAALDRAIARRVMEKRQ
ncbi:MAG TPA: hypothetical protein VGQ78_01470 [Vicinamibacteria bacterium]|jgi:hypothetical protein|nr:hypothetical protein [Vicinamibacteria bacterium]